MDAGVFSMPMPSGGIPGDPTLRNRAPRRRRSDSVHTGSRMDRRSTRVDAPVAESGWTLPDWALTSAILNCIDDLVALLDAEGRILWFNAACERASGSTLETVRGTHISALFDT